MSVPSHHMRQDVCSSRAPYREGRKPKAVKVYTVNQESRYLLIQGVPAVGASQELIKLFAVHGTISEYRILDDYPSDHFTEVYLIKFERIQAARIAKRKLDDWSFYGGVLHVCYAPEYESVHETREKLQDRRKAIAAKVRQYEKDGTYTSPYPSTSHDTGVDHPESQSLSRQLHGDKERSHTEKFHRKGPQKLHQTSMENSMYNQQSHLHEDISGETFGYNVEMHQHSADRSANFYNATAASFSHIAAEQIPNNASGADQSVHDVEISATHSRSPDFHQGGMVAPEQTVTGSSRWGRITPSRWSYPAPSTSTSDSSLLAGPSNQEQLELPLPPRQVHYGMSRHNQRLKSYSFAHVPTAQAEFPVDYDARLNPPAESEKYDMELNRNSEHGPSDEELNRKVDKPSQLINVEISKDTIKRTEDKSMQEKIEESLKKKTDLVIKNFDKNRPVPKFIPRQAQIKKKPSDTVCTETAAVKEAEIDTLNKEIKRNAFTLGKPQGPVNPGNKLEKEVEKTEVSVEKTMKDIRKRMIQLSENRSILSKRKRVTEDTT